MFDSAEVDFYDYSVPRDGVQFLEAIWKKYGNFISLQVWDFCWRSRVDSSLLCVGTNEEHQLWWCHRSQKTEERCVRAHKRRLPAWLHIWILSKTSWNLFSKRNCCWNYSRSCLRSCSRSCWWCCTQSCWCSYTRNYWKCFQFVRDSNYGWDSRHIRNPYQRSSWGCFHRGHGWSPWHCLWCMNISIEMWLMLLILRK